MNVGDAIRPKGCGPIMTVAELLPVDGVVYAYCVWFDAYGHEQRKPYLPAALEAAHETTVPE